MTTGGKLRGTNTLRHCVSQIESLDRYQTPQRYLDTIVWLYMYLQNVFNAKKKKKKTALFTQKVDRLHRYFVLACVLVKLCLLNKMGLHKAYKMYCI